MDKETKTRKSAKKSAEPKDPREAKLAALSAAMGQIEKNYGRGAVMKLGDESVEDVEVIPSGSIGLDYALVAVRPTAVSAVLDAARSARLKNKRVRITTL